MVWLSLTGSDGTGCDSMMSVLVEFEQPEDRIPELWALSLTHTVYSLQHIMYM